jgi:hypothetical protein
MSIEAMKQALEALENAISDDKPYNILKSKEAINALRQAIAEAENQQQIAEDFIKYGASWSKGGKRIDPSEIYAPAQTPVHAIDITSKSIETAVLAEREACEKLCEKEAQEAYHQEAFYLPQGNPGLLRIAEGAKRCADAIRARGSENGLR